MTHEEIIQKIQSMPKEQWFGIEDVTGGGHSPAVWKVLCHMDTGKVTHEGYIFGGDQVRLHFIWYRPEEKPADVIPPLPRWEE